MHNPKHIYTLTTVNDYLNIYLFEKVACHRLITIDRNFHEDGRNPRTHLEYLHHHLQFTIHVIYLSFTATLSRSPLPTL